LATTPEPWVVRGRFIVAEGLDKRTKRRVAIKKVHHWTEFPEYESFEQVMATMKSISHPNCVELLHVHLEDNTPRQPKAILVFDLVTGDAVLDRLEAETRFSEERAAAVTADVLKALQCIHGLGIAHGGVELQNMLFVTNDRRSAQYNTVKLTALSLNTRVPDACERMTVSGIVMHAAPEALSQPLARPGPAGDVWALGVGIYTMLCGFAPFYAESIFQQFQAIVQAEFDFPAPYWDAVSADAQDLIAKVLRADPEERLSATQCLEHSWLAGSKSIE